MPTEDPSYDIFTTVGVEGRDGSVNYVTGVDPEFYRSRRILLHGQNLEHVSDGIQGIWVYRAM